MNGIETNMGVFYNMMDKFKLALDALNSANKKLKDGGGMKKTTLLKMLLSQMGVACIVKVSDVEQVAKFFYKEKNLQETCGPHHLDNFNVSINLARSYDAFGRYTQTTCIWCFSHGITTLI